MRFEILYIVKFVFFMFIFIVVLFFIEVRGYSKLYDVVFNFLSGKNFMLLKLNMCSKLNICIV